MRRRGEQERWATYGNGGAEAEVVEQGLCHVVQHDRIQADISDTGCWGGQDRVEREKKKPIEATRATVKALAVAADLKVLHARHRAEVSRNKFHHHRKEMENSPPLARTRKLPGVAGCQRERACECGGEGGMGARLEMGQGRRKIGKIGGIISREEERSGGVPGMSMSSATCRVVSVECIHLAVSIALLGTSGIRRARTCCGRGRRGASRLMVQCPSESAMLDWRVFSLPPRTFQNSSHRLTQTSLPVTHDHGCHAQLGEVLTEAISRRARGTKPHESPSTGAT
jgi:hypothetical protein